MHPREDKKKKEKRPKGGAQRKGSSPFPSDDPIDESGSHSDPSAGLFKISLGKKDHNESKKDRHTHERPAPSSRESGGFGFMTSYHEPILISRKEDIASVKSSAPLNSAAPSKLATPPAASSPMSSPPTFGALPRGDFMPPFSSQTTTTTTTHTINHNNINNNNNNNNYSCASPTSPMRTLHTNDLHKTTSVSPRTRSMWQESTTPVNLESEDENSSHSTDMKNPLFKNNEILCLNVGGVLYTTTIETLTSIPNSMLGAMFSGKYKIRKDREGNFFIDRDGKLFRHILNFLRNGELCLEDPLFQRTVTRNNAGNLDMSFLFFVKSLLYEAQFFGLESLEEVCRDFLENATQKKQSSKSGQYAVAYLGGYGKVAQIYTKDTGTGGFSESCVALNKLAENGYHVEGVASGANGHYYAILRTHEEETHLFNEDPKENK